MGGGRRKRDEAVRIDGSIPFAFLLGNRYSGYKQVLNSSRELKPMTSKLPKLFWGLSNEQRRLLATRMLEAGHSGAELERAVRFAIWGQESSRRSVRAPSRSQPWDDPNSIDGGLTGVGPDGRPFVPERFRPREPFLVVEAEEVHTFGSGGRVEKAHERSGCAPARRRRQIQEMMRARVQVQEEFLAGLKVDRRAWHRYQTHTVKSNAVASLRRRLQARLAYGNDQSGGVGSDMTSFGSDYGDKRQAKGEVARALAVARQAKLNANTESARMRRWEKEVLKTIRTEASNSLQTPGTSLGGNEDANGEVGGGGCGPELARVLHELSMKHGVDGQRQDLGLATPAGRNTPRERNDGRAGSAPSKEELVENQRRPSAQEKSAACERSGNDDRIQLHQRAAAAAVSGGGEAERGEETPQQNQPSHERCDGDVVRGVQRKGEEVTHSDLSWAEISGGDAASAKVTDDGEEERQVGRRGQDGDEAIKNMMEKLLRTSSSVAFAAARPLSIRPPPILDVPEDPHQVKLAFRKQSWTQKRFPPPPRTKSERIYVGGGYRINLTTPVKSPPKATGIKDAKTHTETPMVPGIGHDGGVGKPGSTSSLSPNSAGGGKNSRTFADTSPVSCPALLSTAPSAGEVLDLDAVTVAARRMTREGSSGSSHQNLPPHHPRNRFAPMAENELERFFLQPWSDGFVAGGNNVRGCQHAT